MQTGRSNNFGFLRLLFASLVIVSHSAELLDGNRSREVLTKVFGTISFGELAVDGFFLISGYLILKSFLCSSNIKSYITKRVLRIYPGFIVASLFCIFVLIPMSGEWHLVTNSTRVELLKSVFRIFLLDTPQVMNSSYPSLNGSMWSIWIEFICYLCIPMVYCMRVNKNKIYCVLALTMMFIFLYTQISAKNIWLPYIRLDIHHTSRLLFAFLIGGLFFLYNDKLIWNRWLTVLCGILLLICLNYNNFAEVGLMTFGAYLLFNFALNYQNSFLSKVGSKTDISYGVYLYAWPTQIYLIKYYPQINLYILMILTFIFASLLGYLSWCYVEKPFITLKSKLDL